MLTPIQRQVVEDQIVDLLSSHFELALDLITRTRAIDHLPKIGQIAQDSAAIARAGELMFKRPD